MFPAPYAAISVEIARVEEQRRAGPTQRFLRRLLSRRTRRTTRRPERSWRWTSQVSSCSLAGSIFGPSWLADVRGDVGGDPLLLTVGLALRMLRTPDAREQTPLPFRVPSMGHMRSLAPAPRIASHPERVPQRRPPGAGWRGGGARRRGAHGGRRTRQGAGC